MERSIKAPKSDVFVTNVDAKSSTIKHLTTTQRSALLGTQLMKNFKEKRLTAAT